MSERLMYKIAVVALVGLVGVSFFVGYDATSSCRALEDISKNEQINSELRNSLTKYVNSQGFRDDIEDRAGEVFELDSFSVSFVSSLESIGLNFKKPQLVVKLDRKDKLFSPPYYIQEVGVGFSRVYLMFKNKIPHIETNDNLDVQLQSDSYVDCRVGE